MVVETRLRPSNRLQVAIAFVSLVSIACVVWAPVGWSVSLLASALVALSALRQIWQIRYGQDRVSNLKLDASGALALRYASGREVNAMVCDSSTVLASLISLTYNTAPPSTFFARARHRLRRPAVLLLPDMVSAEDWRRLLLLLRWQ